MKRLNTNFFATASVFVLFFVFVCSALTVIMLGARVQRSVSDFSELSFSERTLLSYLAEKLRQNDGTDDIYVGEFDGQSALFIESSAENTLYTDIIYCFDGWLCELFCEKGMDFSLNDGTKIIEAGTVSFSEPEPGLVFIRTTDRNNNETFLHIFLRSGGEL